MGIQNGDPMNLQASLAAIRVMVRLAIALTTAITIPAQRCSLTKVHPIMRTTTSAADVTIAMNTMPSIVSIFPPSSNLITLLCDALLVPVPPGASSSFFLCDVLVQHRGEKGLYIHQRQIETLGVHATQWRLWRPESHMLLGDCKGANIMAPS